MYWRLSSPNFRIELEKVMIATKDSLEPQSSERLPNSDRIYVKGELHADVRVPFREIKLSDTKTFDGRVEANASVRVYDCSGPWGDPTFSGDVTQGLPRLRENWINGRGDVEEYDGREVKPRDDGYLSEAHQEYAAQRAKTSNFELKDPNLPKRRPLRASAGHPVTQLWYARQGIITPEMEFIAIRENMRGAHAPRVSAEAPRIGGG